MLLKIVRYPDKSLRQRCAKVEAVTPEIKQLALDMIETMIENKGVGLAAPQVGVQKRIIVVKPGEQAFAFINPEITNKTKETDIAEEGCLCLPKDFFVNVKRSKGIEFTALDESGNDLKIKAEGFMARIVQHETEHLDGILIIDKLGLFEKLKKIAGKSLRKKTEK
jgi:peptide deformylase